MMSRVADLSPEKRALLEARILRRTPPSPVSREAILHPPHGPLRLSYAQESLWFLDQLEPNSPLYNIPEALSLSGSLNLAALEKTFAAIVKRHAALRTRFAAVDGKPTQIVQENNGFKMSFLDLSQLLKEEQQHETHKAIKGESKRPFNLTTDLMFRATLLKLSNQEHVLILNMHHIVSDHWSFAVLHQEIGVFYEAFCKGLEPVLPELQMQFPEFAACQRERLQGPVYESQLAYWKKQLSGELPVLELPTDRPQAAVQGFKGTRQPLDFPATLLGRLKAMSREKGVTVYMTLLAAFNVLLHRYSNQEDIILGAPISGRNHTESEKLIGYFVNTLPIRVNMAGDPSFDMFLKQVRDTVLGAFSNQDLPIEKVLEEMHLSRRAGRNPLFQAIFQFLATPFDPIQMPGLQIEVLGAESETSKFDLTLTLAEAANGLVGNIEYNTDLFEAVTIQRMMGHYRVLLEAIVLDSSQPISSLPILPAEERQQLLIEWNAPGRKYPRHSSIHELFAIQADQTPDAIAVAGDGKLMSYAELDVRSNQLAHHLRKLGVGPDVLVGFCVERSLEMIIGLLGILKAGGAYVTIDPNYPAERLSYLIEDSGARAIVTTSKFKELFKTAARVICLDEDAAVIAQENINSPFNIVSAENLAYVIYTSGSTGKPKGVSVPHRGVVRLVKESNYLRFSRDDVFLQFAPILFDASTLEIWGPLLNGGKLVLFPPAFESLEQLGEIIKSHRITTLWLTAGLFHQMIESHIEALKGVRYLLAGGDVLSVAHVLKACRELPDTELINGYGPTENTTFTCCYSIPKNWKGSRSVPIGKPVSQTQVYILDKRMNPVPIGVAGELFVGGDGLAREYLNAPELTAEKFVANPFGEEPGQKLYRTGDLARWLPEGNIEFVGRLDFQVKIRGFRVELGEIEMALCRNEAVQECIVVAREDKSATKHLAAYVVLHTGANLTATDLRHDLGKMLPDHMVPSHFVFLDKLPLNPNGKVDRRQLPEPGLTGLSTEAIAIPRNAMEEALAKIWIEVLGVGQVGIDQNFFELGGHSLLATQVISRIRKAFETDLPLRAIFEAPTISGLAEAITRNKQTTAVAPAITRRVRRGVSPAPQLNL